MILIVSGFIINKLRPEIYWFTKINFSSMCSYPSGSECSEKEYCIFLEPNKSKCVPRDNLYPEIKFPLPKDHSVICTQPVRSNQGRTHSYLNTSYAVDLASPSSVKNSDVISIFEGKATINTGCDNKDKESFNNDYCGNGFGNWIVIYDKNSNLMAFYAHLRKININDGDFVKPGQIIGEEGKTGSAGHHHLHFSIHRNIFNLDSEKVKKYGIWLPPSIPYKVKVRIPDDSEKLVSVEDLPCQDSNDLNREPFFGL